MGKRSRKAGSRQKQTPPAKRVFGLAGWVFLVLSQDGTTVNARGNIVTTQGGMHLTQFGQEHFKMLSNASLEQGELFPNGEACDTFLKERAAVSAEAISPDDGPAPELEPLTEGDQAAIDAAVRAYGVQASSPEGVLVPADEAGNGE